jgi:putative thiamine transport system ATP-binding protein
VALSLKDVTIRKGVELLLGPFDLTIAAGETVTLMGPSGSGKSSLLSYLAGDVPEGLEGHGDVHLNSRALNELPPEARRIGRLFQDDLLFPHMTVGENLLFGMPRGDRHERAAKMEDALKQAGLAGYAGRAPHTLSGGERARVALFRTLLAEPEAVLLDEPFSKLDMELRASLRSFVFGHLHERRLPALLVTHDRADAPPGGRVFKIALGGEVRRA